MGLDSSIALQVKPVQIDNPLNQLAQFSQVQAAQNQNALAQYTISKAQREDADTQAVRNLLTGAGGDLEAGKNALYKGGYYKQAMELGKSQLEQKAKEAEIGKNQASAEETRAKVAVTKMESLGQTLGALEGMPNVNPQMVATAIQHHADMFGIPADKVQASIAGIPQDPEGLRAFLSAKKMEALKVADQLKYTTPTADAKLQADTSIKTTGMNNATSRANTAANNATSRANNSDNIAKDLTINGIGKDGTPTDDVESMAKGIAEGKLAPINGFALAKPRGQAIMARVMELNPTYDAGDYAAKNAALKGFSTGKEGTALRSFNVAVDHLDTLGNMADALNNNDTRLLNTIGNAWAKQAGGAAPTNFDAVKEIVSKEVVKAIVAGGGGVGEREEISRLMDKANSPAQLKGVISHFRELMDAQRAGLLDQYKRTTGRTDGETVFAASTKPPAQQVEEAVANGAGTKLAALRPVQVKTAADYAKLPSGTVFETPDGKHRVKQ